MSSGSRRPGVVHPHRRMRLMFLTVLFVFSLFAVQLLRLQALDASSMAQAAFGHRLTHVSIPAARGEILDANGTVLASTIERYDVSVNQRAVVAYQKTVDGHLTTVGVAGAAADLAPLIGKTVPETTALLTGNRVFSYVAKGVPAGSWHRIQQLGINGIFADPTAQRVYPTGATAAALVGFVGQDGTAGCVRNPRTGATDCTGAGLELMMNAQLRGRPGKRSYEASMTGQQIATAAQVVLPAQPGRDIRLTVNADLQFYAQNVLAQQVTKTGALSGTVVAMNVTTGDLLAVANYPTFDPAHLGSATAADLDNRAFDEIYEPGSTSKVMTAAAALEEGVVTPSTPVTVPGSLKRSDRTFHDSHAHGTEHLTFAGVLAQSSNIGTILVGERVKAARMYGYLTRFGIGRPSGVGFPGESRGLLTPVQDWNGSQRYTILFGQGLSLTAVQAAGVFQTIANDGLRMPPRLVSATEASDGTVTATPASTPVRVISPEAATQLRAMLEGVVSKDGTAPEAKVPGYRVAGKTGTADRYDQAAGKYSGKTASFIGFAPADKPQIVVAVTLQRPVRGYYGGTVAAPVFAKVMMYALQEYLVPPTGTRPPVVQLTPPAP